MSWFQNEKNYKREYWSANLACKTRRIPDPQKSSIRFLFWSSEWHLTAAKNKDEFFTDAEFRKWKSNNPTLKLSCIKQPKSKSQMLLPSDVNKILPYQSKDLALLAAGILSPSRDTGPTTAPRISPPFPWIHFHHRKKQKTNSSFQVKLCKLKTNNKTTTSTNPRDALENSAGTAGGIRANSKTFSNMFGMSSAPLNSPLFLRFFELQISQWTYGSFALLQQLQLLQTPNLKRSQNCQRTWDWTQRTVAPTSLRPVMVTNQLSANWGSHSATVQWNHTEMYAVIHATNYPRKYCHFSFAQ